jgi:hypothetical protein
MFAVTRSVASSVVWTVTSAVVPSSEIGPVAGDAGAELSERSPQASSHGVMTFSRSGSACDAHSDLASALMRWRSSTVSPESRT